MYEVQFAKGDEVDILQLPQSKPLGITFNLDTGNYKVYFESIAISD
ncbi:MAG: hypothetical protein ACPKPY_03500 [Nitrososphaeraceae archaeon]